MNHGWEAKEGVKITKMPQKCLMDFHAVRSNLILESTNMSTQMIVILKKIIFTTNFKSAIRRVITIVMFQRYFSH